MSTVEGKFIAKPGAKFAIVAGRFNDFVVERLISGAKDCLVRHGVDEANIDLIRVPGAFEIPAMAGHVARTGEYSAVICLGAVIRGDTPHFEYVSAEVSKGIANLSMEIGIPMIYGVLTTDTLDQAIERAGSKAGNRGFSAAMDALEMADLYAQQRQD
ncbi:MAG TPA: 6,7-dimethyl-8-ribityllumazine synthase [candidate division Zixibacteria bacterium]|nr:6,7-dimethyl-8-ribityllumazine synthase [candidate division Zixibacteria bacterium]